MRRFCSRERNRVALCRMVTARRLRKVVAQDHDSAEVARFLLLVGLGQDGDVLRARSLGDGHEVDRLAQKDILVAAQK